MSGLQTSHIWNKVQGDETSYVTSLTMPVNSIPKQLFYMAM